MAGRRVRAASGTATAREGPWQNAQKAGCRGLGVVCGLARCRGGMKKSNRAAKRESGVSHDGLLG
jgi:hypothetical protein